MKVGKTMPFKRLQEPVIVVPQGDIRAYSDIKNTLIDSQNDVFYQDGNHYVKIGYEITSLDTFISNIPSIMIGAAVASAFFPRGRREGGVLWTLVAIVIAFYFLLWYNLVSWVLYKLVSQFAKPIIEFTNNYKFIRPFLPCVWFIDQPTDKEIKSAQGSTMLIPLLILCPIWFHLLNEGTLEGAGFAGLIIPVFSIFTFVNVYRNYKLNKLFMD